VLAENDVRQRYRRSTVGQFWVTISMGATILGMGLVFSVVLGQPISSYLPFLATGFVIWSFVSQTIVDLSTGFIKSEAYIRSYPGPKSVIIYRIVANNLLILMHNFLILPFVWLLFGFPLTSSVILVLPGFILCIALLIVIGLVLAPLCTRFRDFPQIIQSLMQLLFFLTPIMFKPEQTQTKLVVLTRYNPLANLIEIMRAPLLGYVPDPHHYVMVLIYLLIGFVIALLIYARYRARIIYWL
jgi:lipopolysaccharide transport system permease protein